MPRLQFPQKQSVAFSNILFSLYHQALTTQEEEIVFDLSKSKSLSPFGIILLTSMIFECQSQGKKCKYISPKNSTLKRFFRHIGFNNFFNLKDKSNNQEIIKSDQVQLKLCHGLDYDIIDRLMFLFRENLNLSPALSGSIRISLLEAMTNAVDHSGASKYHLCAHTYKPRKQIRFCIADMGVGIKQSLISTDKYKDQIHDDHGAILLATESGVSSRPQAAGLGLDHIRQFIKVNEGQLCIISGKGKVFWKYDHGKIMKQTMHVPYNGTILKFIVNIDKEGFYFLADEKDYIF